MHYTLHQLKIFLKVAEKQSITKAAEELHLTQPAVSLQLKKLQEQFELPLTEVIGRQLYITDFGLDIMEKSQRILDQAEEIKYTIDQHKGFVTGKIKISVVSTGKYVIPYLLKPFMDLHPGIDVSLDVSNKNRVVEGLIRNESDFSLVSLVPEDLKVERLELMENRLYLVGNKEYMSQVKRVRDLEKQTLLFREEGSATRSVMESYLREHNVKPLKSMELVSNEAVKQAVIAGIGLSIVPLIGLRNALQNERIGVLNVKGLPVVTRWNLIYASGKNLTPAQREFIRFIQDNREQLIEEHFKWALEDV